MAEELSRSQLHDTVAYISCLLQRSCSFHGVRKYLSHEKYSSKNGNSLWKYSGEELKSGTATECEMNKKISKRGTFTFLVALVFSSSGSIEYQQSYNTT